MGIQTPSRRAEKLLFTILFAYLILLTLQVRRGQTSLLGATVMGLFSPLLQVYDAASRTLSEGFQAYVWQRDAALAAERAQRENRVLQGLLLSKASLEEENRRLRSLLSVAPRDGFEAVGARALTQYGLPFNRYLLVTAATTVTLSELTPVVVPEGVVGRMQRGRGGLLRCVLITDPNSAVGILSERTSVHGVAAGDGKNLLLRWVTNEADVVPGDRFLTSGDDGVFPEGIPVGTVVTVSDGPDYLKRATLKPSANLEDLQWVLLLLRTGPRGS